ncbi:hypothetical protein V8C37DRAFT_389806 [Trichoderma ceciliae]
MSEDICIAPRCVFCQFEVDYGVAVDIVKGESWQRVTMGQSREHHVCGNLTSSQLHHACHPHCLQIVGSDCSRRLLQATKYFYTPTTHEENRRRRWIRDALTSQLCMHYGRLGSGLSPELWALISDQLLQYCAVANARNLWDGKRSLSWDSKRYGITTAKSIWCGFTRFEGIIYVSSLSNARNEQGLVLELVCAPANGPPECLLVAENHLGITRLRLTDFRTAGAVNGMPGIWWRTIRLDDQELDITVESDGIKLRRLISGQRGSIAWNIPEPKRARFHYFDADNPKLAPARMTSFKCNDPAINGYSLLWASGLALFHAHTAGEDTSLYQSAPRASWLYIPMDRDEVITEVWQRKARLPRERAVGFKTNKGRIFVAGAYLKQLSTHRPFVLVERPSRRGSRIFFEDSTDGIGSLAFAGDAPAVESVFFSCPLPSPNNVYVATEDFFFSSHPLENLAEVTPCHMKEDNGITGMLLVFSDGHRASVGQVRLDSLGPSIAVSDTYSWFLAFARMGGIYPYVTALGTTRSEVERDSLFVLELFCHGTLEWIWSRRQCLVIYRGQRSPETL